MKRVVFTDGSASPNPGPGGFSVIDSETGEPLILGCSKKTTNIVMEGEAMAAAMEAFPEVEIHSDSEFWINVLTKWAPGWKKNNWTKRTGSIKNLELVKRLYALYTSNKVALVWVRGHVGTEMNEKADEWANNAREKKTFGSIEIIEIEPKGEE
ncbi:ribonuclease HI [Candidatus Saccharibacteria bacterium]|nr:ribonuclease HI [Candidatus Saccharibacteria bacterium]